ncbi:neuroblast differentiation-associated protein AHNAK-like [Solea solea]|uniref:neuroblast differentiation-associated protein AHNAK-like n=1 Tax=Solea solea TaxID=90069 RepID=UPI00272D947F|nr:neuroblast differentiation-associated protein AHNAK-like [Solea solea]
MCDCFHLAFPNWHAASSGTGAGGRRLRAPEPGTEDDSVCDEPPQFTEGERPRPQGSSPVEEFPETDKYTDSDKECDAEHDPRHKSGTGKKRKKSGLGSMFEKRSTPKMSKLKELPSPESGVIVKTAKDGCAEGLIYGGGGKEGIFIKEVVPESPASKSLKLKEGDQVLSATVYFDNVPYEDAIQILEHAQAYKVKLCLKRKPDITETEPAMDSDVIPEDEVCAPEMREQGKTKRRGDARISWPKFPSFGKGGKSRFTRSHSSSEADEQRKLELSPTTSDTESPIKSQDGLKGKKRHKMKLSVLTKRGRISSSEDQDTEAPTTGQTSDDIHQTASDMLSPECIESLSGQIPEVFVTEDVRVVEEIRLERSDQIMTEPVQHKVELISIDSTLKTEDLTMALADQGSSPPGIKSPKEKKSKKERSQLKMKILGKEKSHKKDAKGSPKRLKTLGASIEAADQPGNETSDAIPGSESQTQLQGDNLLLDINTSDESQLAKSATPQKEMSIPTVDFDISSTFMRKSQKQEQAKKDDIKQKQEIKTCPTFKLPKLGFSDISTEETVQTVNVEERPTKMKRKSEDPAVKDDPYDILSKSSQLPKREDIEIPGMEDMAVRTKAKGIKEPKVGSRGHHEEMKADAVQMLIDVNSVKAAVSKLPGFKLPKVDTSGVPIPEEITVIDANAQRISVKTPTKVADTKSKYGGHLMKVDITASPEIKLPKITPAASTSEDLLVETKVDFKTPEKVFKTEVYKREDIIIPGKESKQGTVGITFENQSAAMSSPKESSKKSSNLKITTASFKIAPVIQVPEIAGDFTKQNNYQEGDALLGRRTIVFQGETPKTGERQIGAVVSDVKMPDIDSIEYIDSVSGSPAKMGVGINLTGFGVHLDATKPKTDIDVEAEVKLPDAPEVNVTLEAPDVSISEQKLEIEKPELEIKPLQTEVEFDLQRSKFKMPKFGIKMPKMKGPQLDISLPRKDMDGALPEGKAAVKLPDAPDVDVDLGSIDVSIPEQKLEVEKLELEIKPLQTDIELDGQRTKFKMPKFGIKMPKMKGPQLDISLPKKDMDITIPEAKAEVKLLNAPEVDINLGGIDVSIPEQKLEVEKPELEIKPLQTDIELDGQGSKFKMPKFGIKMPNVKGPELDLNLQKKEVNVKLPEAKAEVKLPEAPEVDVNLGSIDVSIPEQKLEVEKPELEIKPLQTDIELDGQGSKFKMPKFGIKMPKVKGPELDLSLQKKEVDVTIPEAKAEVKLPEAPDVDVTLGSIEVSIPEQKLEIEKPELEIKPLQTEVEFDLQRSKFKMPKFGIKMPKMKGPQLDISMSKKDMHVTLPEGKAAVKLPDAPDVDVTLGSIDVSIPEQKLEVEKPELEIKPLQTDIELDGQGSKFKMPKFGIKMPKMKGPQLDISLPKKDMDITIPEAEVKLSNAPEVDINLGSVDVSIPEQTLQIEKTELEIKHAEVEFDGQFKMQKIGISMPKVKGPEIDFNMSKQDMDIKFPEAKAEIQLPDVELKEPSTEVEFNAPEIEAQLGSMKGSPSKFKLPTFKFPKFGIATPAVSAEVPDKDIQVEATIPEVPEIDVNLGKAEVLIPEGKLKVQKVEMEIKSLKSEGEFDGQGGKFKMPKFGISMPKVKGPEIDISLSKKDVDIKLPEAKAEVSLPDVELKEPSAKVEVKAPEIEAQLGSMKGSPSKFKLPTFKLPKFGVAAPDVSAKVPDTDKDIKVEVTIPEVPEIDVNLGKAEVTIPEGKIEVQKPEVELKPLQMEVELDGQGGKFKMPKLGMSMPKVKGPEIDISISKKDVDIKLPEAKAKVSLPDVELKEPSAKVEVQAPEIEAQLGSMKGSASKFKLPSFKFPKFGVAVPDVSAKVPDTDKDIKVEVKIPDVPEIDVNLGKAEVFIPEGKLEVQKPEVEIKPLQTEVELDGQGSKFKMPKLGMSMPKIKGPEIDISISKKDADIKLPEAEAEVNLPDIELKAPSAKVEVQAPEIEAQLGSMKGSPSKFKLPTFKFPKFGVAAPDVNAKVPDTDKDIKVEVKIPDIPEIDVNLGKVEVLMPEGKLEVQKPEVEIKPLQTEVELDGQGSKFKMPKLGMSMPKIKGPEIDISISKKDVDIKLPETEAEVSLPDIELKQPSAKVEVQAPEIEAQLGSMKGSPSKFKLPTFKFPKFGVAAPDISAKVPDTDKDIKVEVKIPDVPEIDVNLGKAEVLIPEGKIEVQKPEVEIKPLQMEVELDGQGSKFKMPKLGMSMPKVKGPEIDISISKKDADIKLPKVEGELNLPDIEIKEPSAKVEVKAPEIEAQLGSMKGSPSKFKLPTFKFPKFGVATPDVSANVPDTDKDIKVEVKIPDVPEIDVKAEVLIPEGKLEVQKPEVELKPLQTEVELDGQGSKFKMPKLGMSMPKIKGPEIDISISKKDADIKLPETEAEVSLSDIELKEPSAKVEIQAPEIEAQLGSMKGSQSKFKLPTFKFPKFGVAATDVSAKVPDADKDIKVEVKIPDVPEIDVNLGKAEVLIPEGKLEVQKPEVEIKPLQMEVELDGQGSKFKMPKLGMSMPKVKGPEIDISITKKDADIKLPKVEGEFSLPDVELKEPSAKVEVQAPEIEAQLGSMKGSPSKFKLPTFKFPKFGVAAPDVSAKVPDSDKDIKVEVKIPDVPEIDVKAEVLIPEGKLEVQTPEVELKPLQTEVELDGQGSKFKMPKLGMSMPKIKGPEIDISISKKDADIKLPETEAEVSLSDIELKEPSAKVEIQAPEIEAQLGSMKGSQSKFKLPTFKFPKFGVAAPDVSAKVPDTDKDIKVEVKIPDVPEIDVNLGKAEVLIPEGKLEVQKPEVEIKPLQMEVELDGQGSKFKMPKLGMSMPKVKGPEIDISISKKDADIKLPKVEGEFSLPDVELKEPSAKVEVQAPEIEAQLGSMKGSPSKFKLPTFKFPKFGVAAPDVSAKVPDSDKDIKVEVKIPDVPEIDVKAEVLIPEGKLEVQKPEVEIKPLQTEVELDGQGSKFKMPKLGMSMPKIKGPEIDISISKKDADIKLPETEAEVRLPDIELKEPSAKVEIQAPEIEAQLGSMKGSQSKFKLPTFKFPKFGVAAADVSAKVPDTDKDIKVEARIPEVPEIDVHIGKAEVLIPEGKLEVQKPEVEIKPLQMEVELDGQGSKFKMPKLGMSMPKVKGPEIDISLSKKDVDIKLPEAKAEVSLPDVELKEPSAKVEVQAPEIEAQLGSMKGSPSKFKLPTFKLPKFGVAAPDVSAKVPDTDKDIKVEVKIPDIPEIDVNLGKAEVLIPEGKLEVQKPEVEIKPLQMEVELDGQGGKLKMPKIGMSMPKVKGPEIDISISKKDVDIKLPKVEAEVSLPDVELKESSAKVEVQAPEIEAQLGSMKGSPSKFKLPTFKFPKFGHATSDVSSEVPDIDKDIKVDVKIPEVPEIDVNLGKAEVLIPEANMEVQIPEMVIKPLQTEGEHDGQGSKFKMPKFGIKKPKLKGPELDVSLPKKDIDVTLQEAKAEVRLPDAPEVDVTLGGIDIQIPQQKLDFEKPDLEIKPGQSEVELDGQGRKFKMPKLGMSMPKVKGPEIDISISKKDADIKLPEGKAEVSVVTDVDLREPSAKIEVKAPEIEPQLGSVKESPSKFKLPTFKFPKFGTASPNVSAEVPDTDEEIKIDGAHMHISAPHTTVDFPEVKASVTLPDIEVKEPSADIVIVQQPGIEVDAKVKKPRFSLPKFSFSKTSVKATEVVSPDFDVDVTSPEVKEEIYLPEVEVKGSSVITLMEESPNAEFDTNLKKSKFSLPKISFSKSSVATAKVSAALPQVDVSLKEGEVIVKQPEMEIKSPELESQQGSKFKIPKFGIALPKAKGPEVDLTTSQKDADITLPDVKAEVKLPEVDVKESSTSVETEAKSKDVGGSPLKFKMPTLKMPKFGSATHDVTVEAPDADKAEISSAKLEEDITIKISGPSVDVTAVDSETPKTDTDDIDHGSPSRFKLPSFKMPRLSLSRPKTEEENVPTEVKEDELETARETKSPKMTLTSFGEMLKNFDVEFDVSQPDKEEGENLGTREPSGDQLDAKEKDTDTKQGAAKSPEKTSWFKFPRFGLSSPSEPVKTFEKEEQRDEKSPLGETGAEETSPTCSVQSSDAFADISSTVTSEHVGISISSPTKVTVKYSDPNGATELEEIHSKVITSTTKTEMISVEPNLPEKITILSSGVSSSSEDTVKLESGKIHIISSNIQATPEAQHAKLFSAVQVQSAGGLALESEAGEAASWTVEDSQSGRRTVFERHVVRETSSERSESKETIVITKQVTHIFDSSEPISGETASSIQRLRDTVHSEKMRFFDGAEK